MSKENALVSPYVALVIGALAVSTAAIFVKLSDAPAAVVAAYRLIFAVALMTPVMLWKYGHELKLIQAKDWLFSMLSGLFLALHFVLWFESLNYTSVASSVVLVTLQPIFTFAGAYLFFKERISIKGIFGAVLALFGSVIIFWGDFQFGGLAILGNALALLGAAMVSGYWLFGQNLRHRLSIMTYTYVVYSTSALFIVVYVALTNQPMYPYPAHEWLIFIALAIFPTLLGHSVFNWAVKWVGASMISMTILFEPIGASILAYFILGETLSWGQWLGGAVILSGIYLFLRSRQTKENV